MQTEMNESMKNKVYALDGGLGRRDRLQETRPDDEKNSLRAQVIWVSQANGLRPWCDRCMYMYLYKVGVATYYLR